MLAPLALGAQTQDPATLPSAAAATVAAGSYDVAPVRILGVSAISVAAPVLRRGDGGPDARQRPTVIEGNLSLL